MVLGDAVPVPIRLRDGWGLVRGVRTSEGERVRVLQVGGVYQSATYLGPRRMEPVFSYYRAFDLAFTVRPKTRRALMIGGGGYAWPKHVLACRSGNVTVDVVEIDPAVTYAALRWFYLDEAMAQHPGRLRLVTDDGRAYLERYGEELAWGGALPGTGVPSRGEEPSGMGLPPRGKEPSGAVRSPRGEVRAYDAIVLDAFAGAEPVRSLATVEAARAAKACLAPDGLVLANVVSADGGADVSFLCDVVVTFSEVFSHVHITLCEDEEFAVEDNYLIIATDGDWAVPNDIPFDGDFPGTALWD